MAENQQQAMNDWFTCYDAPQISACLKISVRSLLGVYRFINLTCISTQPAFFLDEQRHQL